jgi:hypothetical protein
MQARRPMLAALVAIVPTTVHAEKEWRYEPKSADDAIHVQANEIYPTNLTQLRLSYRHIDTGGSLVALTSETSIPMPFVIIPGIAFGGMYSIVNLEIPFATLDVPMAPRATGVGDFRIIDAALKYWDRFAAGAGFLMIVPSASHELLGSGELAIGGIAGASLTLEDVSATIIAETATSIVGENSTDDINVLRVRPIVSYYLPYASSVALEPNFLFDWEADGETTISVIPRLGHAVSKNWAFLLEGEWIAVGPNRNDVIVSVGATYLGW